MKVVILAGGLGTRLAEYTDKVPKPMVPVGGKPIIWHVMQRYAKYGYKDFVIALGYKGELIKDYFLRFAMLNSNFTVDLRGGGVDLHESKSCDWKVTLVDTGLQTMTGGRLRLLEKYLPDNEFMMTYGDGVSDVNVDDLVAFHRERGGQATVTAVRPPTRFGELQLSGDKVTSFDEKPQMNDGWISGGYFVLHKSVLQQIESESTMFEREPLEHLAECGELNAYRHEGFWQCMDTKRDLDTLEAIYRSEVVAPWLK